MMVVSNDERLWSGVLGACLVPAGLIALGAAVPVTRSYWRFLQRSRKVRGRIVDWVSSYSDGQERYRSVVEYDTDDGTQRFTDRNSSGTRERGSVTVRYVPGEEAQVAGLGIVFIKLVILPIALVFLGGALATGGGFLLRTAFTGQ
jgi:hypothetical protein